MSALHDALKSLGPINFNDTPLADLKSFLCEAFNNGQLLVDSVPIPAPSDDASSPEGRSRASSTASSAFEISLSPARSAAPPSNVEGLQKEWKPIKLKPAENPLGMSVYKLPGKDGKGAWFARRSVHEGLGFTKWKKGLEREFPETLKSQGGPGDGNIRGIGGEKRLAYKNIEGVGKMEVYLLSAQFPGPTTPRDFVTMVITSDQALKDQSGEDREVPRHFMVISRPCNHPESAPRDGFIRGNYESVEFIREIPLQKGPKKSASATNLASQGQTTRNRSASILGREAILRNATRNHSPPTSDNGSTAPQKSLSPETNLAQGEMRARGKTISFDKSRGSNAKGEGMDVPREDESEMNPVEWIMITRSDPGGSVPRFMVERGTPGGIISDASKFLNWACSMDFEDFDSEDETQEDGDQDGIAEQHKQEHHHDLHKDLQSFQTNGHLAGIEEAASTPLDEVPPQPTTNGGGLYGMVAGAAGAASGFLASHAPAMISDHLPSHTAQARNEDNSPRRGSVSSTSSSTSSVGSFASALENSYCELNDVSSTKTGDSLAQSQTFSNKDKELQKLEDKKRRLDEKLSKAREKELSKKSDDAAKEKEAIRKAEERHEKEIQKQEEKHKKEVEKLERKKAKEERKAEERRRKAIEKDECTRLTRELEEFKAENGVLRKEKEILRAQVGELQAQNTALAARVGKLGLQGEEVLREVRAESGRTGRLRASSLKGLGRTNSVKSGSSIEKNKENGTPATA